MRGLFSVLIWTHYQFVWKRFSLVSTLLAISILIAKNLLFRLFIDGKSSLLTNESNKPEISGMPGKHWVRAPFTFRTVASVSCY